MNSIMSSQPSNPSVTVPDARNSSLQVLESYAGDRSELARLVERSLADPVLSRMTEVDEFRFKFVLRDELESGFRLRLHVWRDKVTDTPHSHRFNFATMVLAGGMTHYVHAPNQDLYPEGISDFYDTHIPITDERVSGLIDPSKFSTEMAFPVVAGSAYFQSSSVMLTSTTVEPGTITLFVRGPAVRPCAFQWHPDQQTVVWRAGTAHAPASRRTEVAVSQADIDHALDRIRAIGIK
ncbi:hypothetical protein HC028_23240 [Planosporangium flavigriseum]|uniref:Uncharacterized protein n=1 Tax=Planosporangium flavigriseum TaxID=373681 RepID=A0A8J3PNJ3_9ACTN|nr:hypothetical protein [Planosporangium flavigriseum]NJC67393.1 hypothetical protein [Planosporangium flavigriseum]GIG74973.1 hypothetical protein Pfl04_33770 [Planosporangium flavigriseum]